MDAKQWQNPEKWEFPDVLERKDREVLIDQMLRGKGQPSLPGDFEFFPFADSEHPVLLFLGKLPGAPTRDLLFYVADPNNQGNASEQWKTLAVFSVDVSNVKMSKEEELLRERMRTRYTGITAFYLHEGTRSLLVPAAGQLFVCKIPESIETLVSGGPLSLAPIGDTSVSGARMDPKWSPDGKFVSFVRNNELWVIDLQTNKEHRLTAADQRKLLIATADYIVQEEFDRYSGYWWAPGDGTYTILYTEIDESMVPKVEISNPTTLQSDSYQFPRPGEPNAVTEVRVLSFQPGDELKVSTSEPTALKASYPWVEYVPRLHWGADASTFYLQLLSRDQTHLALVQYSTDEVMSKASTTSGKVLREKTSDVWINVTDIFHVTKGGEVLWDTEDTGFRHLELIAADGKTSAITFGEWLLIDAAITVDEQNKRVFFVGTKDSDVQRHLYVASYGGSTPNENLRRLTKPGFNHSSIQVNSSGTHFTSMFSNLNVPPACTVNAVDGDTSAVFPLLPFKTPPFAFKAPKIISFRANPDSLRLYACIYTPVDVPADFDSTETALEAEFDKTAPADSKKLPTLIYTYGGPHVQLVTDDFNMTMNVRLQMFTRLGYTVAIVDGRGSNNRGLRFEGQLKYRMGQVEIADQACLAHYLVHHAKLSDPSRIAIHGWSYGGYMTLLAMSQRPDLFKLGIAGAPVVTWEQYDTGYTERYMNTPAENPEGYEKGQILFYADKLPAEEHRLLIVAGLIDENVHFAHTATLIQRLIKMDRPYDLKVFPTERHGMRSWDSVVYYERVFARYLQNHL